jgi:hypothetical protein
MNRKVLKILTIGLLLFGVSYISASRIVFKNKTNYYVKADINITRLDSNMFLPKPYGIVSKQEDKTVTFYINPVDMQKNRGEEEFNYDNYDWQVMSLTVSRKKFGEQDYKDPKVYGPGSIDGLKIFKYVKGDLPQGHWSITSEEITKETGRKEVDTLLGWANTLHLEINETSPGSGEIYLKFKALFGVGG